MKLFEEITVKEKEFKSSYLNRGFNLVKVNGIEITTTKAGDKFYVVIYFEGKPIDDFSGVDINIAGVDLGKSKGKVSKAKLSGGFAIALDDENKKSQILRSILLMAEKLGVTKELQAIDEPSFTTTMAAIGDLFRKSNNYIWVLFQAKEYDTNKFTFHLKENNHGTRDNFDFVVAVKAEADIKDFTRENNIITHISGANTVGSNIGVSINLTVNDDYDLKLLPVASEDTNFDDADDLPF